jgi:hypothetical protein
MSVRLYMDVHVRRAVTDITLEVVMGQQSERTKEGTVANSLDAVQQRVAISEMQPKLHFASEG